MVSFSLSFVTLLAGLGVAIGMPMDLTEFQDLIGSRCFNRTVSGRTFVNGQEFPLANTLENFVHLIEKIEDSNPNMQLEQEVNFLLNNFTIYNLDHDENGFAEKSPGFKYSDYNIKTLWEFEPKKLNTRDVELPLSADEYCSLYTMLSHTINDTKAWFENTKPSYSNGKYENHNSDDPFSASTPEKTSFLREQGVVSIHGTNQTVALGRVLTGIYLALQGVQQKKMSEVEKGKSPLADRDPIVEPLYLLTFVEPLIISQLSKDPKGLFPNGKWRYVKNEEPQYYGTPEVCPTVYELERLDANVGYFYSYSSMRGGIDGAFLGNVISKNKELFRDRKLSEILRQYYSYEGVADKVNPSNKASFCRRPQFLDEMQAYLLNSTDIYLALSNTAEPELRRSGYVSAAKSDFETKRNDIITLEDGLDGYCNEARSENRKVSCESPNDIYIVLDTSTPEFYRKQQGILGYMANLVDFGQNGISATVVADHDTGSEDLLFMPVAASKACLACQITQRAQGSGGRVGYEKTVEVVNKLLNKKKTEQEHLNGAPGKVVIFFRLGRETPTPELIDQLNKIRASNLDTNFYAVGIDEKVLNAYTGNVIYNTIKTEVGDEKQVAEKLASRICEAPGALQYPYCRDGAQETEAVFRGLVSANAKQYWRMDAKYFEKSLDKMNIKVKAMGAGDIQVCHNSGSKPDSEPKNCEVMPEGATKTFSHPNPCNGVSRSACPAILFSIYGLENKTSNAEFCKKREITDIDGPLYCKKLDQIGFEISHEGVRCSGASTLLSTPLLLAFALFFYSLINKNH